LSSARSKLPDFLAISAKIEDPRESFLIRENRFGIKSFAGMDRQGEWHKGHSTALVRNLV
jgi:hypothetical protein